MDDSIFCIDAELEAKAQVILKDLGLDVKTAYNSFLQKVVNEELSSNEIILLAKPKPKKKPVSALRGVLKGKVWISDDFDEPLECMKEYME